jgi:hypothetical protein
MSERFSPLVSIVSRFQRQNLILNVWTTISSSCLFAFVSPFYRLFIPSFFPVLSGSVVLSVISHVNYLQKFLRSFNMSFMRHMYLLCSANVDNLVLSYMGTGLTLYHTITSCSFMVLASLCTTLSQAAPLFCFYLSDAVFLHYFYSVSVLRCCRYCCFFLSLLLNLPFVLSCMLCQILSFISSLSLYLIL